MATVTDIERKSAALRHPGSPCLSPYHTINLTAGCPYACRYCYAQSFRHHPGTGRVLFYANTLALVRDELRRMRRKPRLVHFSTGCEPFNPEPRISSSLYNIMKLLLENAICILAVTKSVIPSEFISLFKKHRGRVRIEVGITTVNDEVRRLMEPGAASVEQRLKVIRRLARNGIECQARMDPLIPGLTDSDESFQSLCRSLASEGLRDAAGSYLFIRRGILRRMDVQTDGWSFADMVERFYTEEITDYCGSGRIRVASREYKSERFESLRRLALEQGIALRFCRCKNPRVTQDACHVWPRALRESASQGALFDG